MPEAAQPKSGWQSHGVRKMAVIIPCTGISFMFLSLSMLADGEYTARFLKGQIPKCPTRHAADQV
jgi:hypothetical protein